MPAKTTAKGAGKASKTKGGKKKEPEIVEEPPEVVPEEPPAPVDWKEDFRTKPKAEVSQFDALNTHTTLERTFVDLYNLKLDDSEGKVQETEQKEASLDGNEGVDGEEAKEKEKEKADAESKPTDEEQDSEDTQEEPREETESERQRREILTGLEQQRAAGEKAESRLKELLTLKFADDEQADVDLQSFGLLPKVDVPPVASPKHNDRVILAQHNLLDVRGIIEGYDLEETRKSLPKVNIAPKALKQGMSARAQERTATSRKIHDREAALIAKKRETRDKIFASTGITRTAQKNANPAMAFLAKKTKKLLSESLTPAQVEENKKILHRMKHRQNFLRNPRYTGEVLPFASLEASQQMTRDCAFRPLPKRVLCDDYAPGNVYELTLSLMNTDTVSKRLRINPPSTQYFALKDVIYPTDTAMIAPGMECIVKLQFSPDSLLHFHDELVIFSDSGSITVPLEGIRPPPKLSLPEISQIGHCIVDGKMRVRIPCKNSGGASTFYITGEEDEYTGQELDPKLTLSNAFSISPTNFYLEKGQSIDLDVCFTPTQSGLFSDIFRVTYDHLDCDVFALSASAWDVQLPLVKIQGNDISGAAEEPSIVLFEDVAVSGQLTKTIELQNPTSLPFHFQWKLGPSNTLGATVSTEGENVSDLFSISPSHGVIEPESAISFDITFKPQSLEVARAEAVLEVLDIPSEKEEDRNVKQILLQGTGTGCVTSFTPSALSFEDCVRIGHTVVRTCTIKNESHCPARYSWSQEHLASICSRYEGLQLSVSPEAGEIGALSEQEFEVSVLYHATTPVEEELLCQIELGSNVHVPIHLTGVQGPQVTFRTRSLDFGLLNYGISGITSTREIHLVNTSSVTAFFQMDGINIETGEVEPQLSFDVPQGSVEAGESVTIRCTFEPTGCQSFRSFIRCNVDHGEGQFISARGEVQAPRVVVNPLSVDVGVTYVGLAKTFSVSVKNLTYLVGKIEWTNVNEDQYDISFNPQSFSIGGMEEQMVEVTLLPKKSGELYTVCGCDIEGVSLPQGFEFRSIIKDRQLAVHEVTSPEQINVLSVASELISEYQSTQNENILELYKSELEKAFPVPSAVACTPHSILHSNTQKVDFGEKAPIFSKQKRRIVIQNCSAMDCMLSVHAAERELRAVSPKTHHLSTGKFGTTSSSFTSGQKYSHPTVRLSRTVLKEDSLLTFKSRTGKQHCKSRLDVTAVQQQLQANNGIGIGLILSTTEFHLGPWETQLVEVTCVNNISGDFTDELIIEAADVGIVEIPVAVSVVGTPLVFSRSTVGMRFPSTEAAEEYPNLSIMTHDKLRVVPRPVVSWAHRLAHSDAFTKKLRIENNGPVDAKIVWKLLAADSDAFDRIISTDFSVGEDGTVQLGFTGVELPDESESLPFSVDCKELIVPARGHSTVVSCLDTASLGVGSYAAVLVADVRIRDTDSNEWVMPPPAMQVRPVVCDLVVNIDEPEVEIEAEELPLRFDAHPYAQREDELAIWTPFTNRSAVPITFSVEAESKSFSILTSDTFPDASAISLVPNQSAMVGVRLEKPRGSAWPSKRVERVRSQLLLTHNNGTVQKVDLEAILRKPYISVDHKNHDFGLIHVDREGVFTVVVSNPSKVDAKWKLIHRSIPVIRPAKKNFSTMNVGVLSKFRNPEFDEGQEIEDDPSAFEFSNTSGVLAARSLPPTVGMASMTIDPKHSNLHRAPLKLQVKFKPMKASHYKSQFQLVVDSGETVDIVLQGHGTYEESLDPLVQ